MACALLSVMAMENPDRINRHILTSLSGLALITTMSGCFFGEGGISFSSDDMDAEETSGGESEDESAQDEGTGESTGDSGESTGDSGESTDESDSGSSADFVCGDGVEDPGEQCDDGNSSNIDGCTEACLVGPTGVALTGAATATALCGNEGGGPTIEECPEGQVLVGFAGETGSYMHKIKGVCGSMELAEGAPIDVDIIEESETQEFGANEGTPWTRMCPVGQAVVGFRGSSGALVNQLVFSCAPLLVDLDGQGYELSIGQSSELELVGGNSGTDFPMTTCPSGFVASQLRVVHGDAIDGFGLGCRELSLI